jgi:glycosyltransferase involved in cell wall biosynthesis
MKVLIMVSRDPENSGFGGGELVLFRWAEILVQAGHRVDYICATFPGSLREATLSGVHVVRVGPESTLGFSAYLEYEQRFRGHVDVVIEDMLGGARLPFFAPLYVREPVVSLWFQDHLPLFRRQFSSSLLPLLAGLERLIVRVHRDRPILVPSEESGQSYVRKGGREEFVTVYNPGLSPEFLAGQEPVSTENRNRQVMFLGKLRRYKGPDVAIRVFAAVAQNVPGATMIVAGRPDQERYFEELVQLVRSLGLEQKVRFERGISEDRKVTLLRTSRVLLSPAPVEGFGIAGLEANACGVPVVGTTGIPLDALQEGVNGYRVAVGDVGAMAEHTRQLLVDDVLFQRLSVSALQFAQRFTWSASVQPLLEILARIVCAAPEKPSAKPVA